MMEASENTPNVTYILFYYLAEDILDELRHLSEPPDPPPNTYAST